MVFTARARFSVEIRKQPAQTRRQTAKPPGIFCLPLLTFERFSRFDGPPRRVYCICPARIMQGATGRHKLPPLQSPAMDTGMASSRTREHWFKTLVRTRGRRGGGYADRRLASLAGCKSSVATGSRVTGMYTSAPADAICSTDLSRRRGRSPLRGLNAREIWRQPRQGGQRQSGAE